MPTWSPARPRRGDRCKYTQRYREVLRAKCGDCVDSRGIVRLFNPETGNAQVRWDDTPGVLYEARITDLVKESHDGPDPIDEYIVPFDPELLALPMPAVAARDEGDGGEIGVGVGDIRSTNGVGAEIDVEGTAP